MSSNLIASARFFNVFFSEFMMVKKYHVPTELLMSAQYITLKELVNELNIPIRKFHEKLHYFRNLFYWDFSYYRKHFKSDKKMNEICKMIDDSKKIKVTNYENLRKVLIANANKIEFLRLNVIEHKEEMQRKEVIFHERVLPIRLFNDLSDLLEINDERLEVATYINQHYLDLDHLNAIEEKMVNLLSEVPLCKVKYLEKIQRISHDELIKAIKMLGINKKVFSSEYIPEYEYEFKV